MPNTLRKIAEADRVKAEIQAVSERLEFMQMTPQNCTALRALKALVQRELPVALDKFYGQVRQNPGTRKFFASETDIEHAKGAQAVHWGNISSGNFNHDYAARVRRIGMVHARIGLEPRWYIGGYAIILDRLCGRPFKGNASHCLSHAISKTYYSTGG